MFNREQQITERFTRAVEQLGHGSSDVRVGAVYALRRIMIDSPRDHDAIVDVLTAFVREHARPRSPTDDRTRVEAQAALIVLGRRPERPGRELDHLRLDEAFLPRAHLRAARLPCARLRRATLTGAHLEGAVLEGARLRGANLDDADLEGALLRYASLEGASLKHAKLRGATLDDASLWGAAMPGARLDDASLRGAHLAGVTGSPHLSNEQRREAHCLPETPGCAEAGRAEPPAGHPCVRFPWD